MTIEEIAQLLKKASEIQFIASAKLGTELLARLQAVATDLRGEVGDLELQDDLAFNKLYDELKDQGKTEQYIKNKHKITPLYQEFRVKKRILSDVYSIRRNLERHTNLLIEQEKFRPRNDNPHYSL